MSALGDDLPKHIIVPSTSSNPSSSPTAIPDPEPKQKRHCARLSHSQPQGTTAGNTMEIESLTAPMSLQSAHNTDDPVPNNAKLEGVFTMDEFLSTHGSEHAAMKAARSTSTAMKIPPGLVPVGARSSKYTIALHMKYQALGIPQPQFTFGGSQGEGWTVKVSFPGVKSRELQGISNGERYASKQEAKEGLSERALDILTRLEEEGKVKKAEGPKSRDSKYTALVHEKFQQLGIRPQTSIEYSGDNQSGWTAKGDFSGLDIEELQGLAGERRQNKKEAKDSLSQRAWEIIEAAESAGKLPSATRSKGQAQQQPQEKEEPGPNYVGQLLEFQRMTDAPQPTYHDFSSGSLFACVVKIDGESQLFGSLDLLHSTKKGAHRQAAREAVEYFKAQGIWPEETTDVGGIKMKRKAQPGLHEILAATSSDSRKPSNASTATNPTSYPQAVARLAVTLALGAPEWRYTTPSSLDPAFVTCSCYFKDGGQHTGPHGEVRNILGKKKAKEECARLTLAYLKEVQDVRLAYGERMMQGVNGGQDAIAGALGRPREEEKKVMEARRRGGRDASELSEDEFEDAVEEF